MESNQIKEQLKATLAQTGNTFQGNEVYLHADDRTRKHLRGKQRKTLRTGPIIPWSAGSGHL